MKIVTTTTYGTVIKTDLDNGSIEVRIEDTGPRIYVSDLGPYKQSDFTFDDVLDLEFYGRTYHVIHIRQHN